MEPFNTRLSFVHALQNFNLEDTRNYVRFHVEQSGGRTDLFGDEAVRKLFHASGGTPRRINQLALQVLINAAGAGIDTITGDFVQRQLNAHPLYDTSVGP